MLNATWAIPIKQCTVTKFVVCRHNWHSMKAAQTPLFPVEELLPDNLQYWISQWFQNPYGILWSICEDGQGHLNLDNLDIWFWYQVIAPKSHEGLVEKVLWKDIFLITGRWHKLVGEPNQLTLLIAQLHNYPMGNRWSWPSDMVPEDIPQVCIMCWCYVP